MGSTAELVEYRGFRQALPIGLNLADGAALLQTRLTAGPKKLILLGEESVPVHYQPTRDPAVEVRRRNTAYRQERGQDEEEQQETHDETS